MFCICLKSGVDKDIDSHPSPPTQSFKSSTQVLAFMVKYTPDCETTLIGDLHILGAVVKSVEI